MMKNTPMNSYEIAYLIKLKLRGELTPDQQKQLEEWFNLSEKNKMLFKKLSSQKEVQEDLLRFSGFTPDDAWKQLDASIKTKVLKNTSPFWLRIASVFVLLLSIGGAIYFISSMDQERPALIVEEISPGFSNAYLVVDGGERMSLLNTTRVVEVEHQTLARIEDGELIYDNAVSLAKTQYHEVIVPEKSEYHFALPDGSEVWLNAGSKLKYPVPFEKEKRHLELEGEIFIKVAKLDNVAFEIDTKHGQVVVTGTEFNVKAYQDEESIVTTLVEGSVKWITPAGLERLLVPGEQLDLDKPSGQFSVNKVDVTTFTAWKDGQFVYDDASLESIMRSLSRWYGIDYEFKNSRLKNRRFTIDVRKYENLATILKMIEVTEKVHFEASNDKIVITEK
jgi:hypothetical protein